MKTSEFAEAVTAMLKNEKEVFIELLKKRILTGLEMKYLSIAVTQKIK